MEKNSKEQLAKESWRVYGRLTQILQEIYAGNEDALHAVRYALWEVESMLPELSEDA